MMIFQNNIKKKLFFYTLTFFFFILEIWQIYPIYEGSLFKDWTYIKNYANCYDLADPSKICEEIKKFDFIYPVIWLNVGHLPIEVFESLLLIIIFLFISILIKILKNENYKTTFLIIFSTPFVLVMQRGNNEMIIFILIYFSILFYQKKKLFSVTLIFISSFLKIYPITTLLIFYKNKIINYFNLIIFLLFLIFMFYIYNDLITISNNLHSKITLAYSSKTILYMWSFIFKIKEKYFFMISIISFFLILIFSLKFKIFLYKQSKEEDFFLVGATILIFSFFLSSSFEYRLIYIILVIPFISKYRKNNFTLFKYIYLIIIFVIWFEFIIFYTHQFINFNAIKNELGYILNYQTIILGFLIGIKNICYWSLNIFFIIILKEILLRRLNY